MAACCLWNRRFIEWVIRVTDIVPIVKTKEESANAYGSPVHVLWLLEYWQVSWPV